MANWITRTVRVAGRERELRPGQTLFRSGQRSTGFYEVIAGEVRLVRTDRAGREAVLYVARPGETLGEASLFASAYRCDAIATTDAVVRLYPKSKVLLEFECDPKAVESISGINQDQSKISECVFRAFFHMLFAHHNTTLAGAMGDRCAYRCSPAGGVPWV